MRHGSLAVVSSAVTVIAATATTPYIVIQKRITITPPTVAHFPATLSPVAPADVDIPSVRKLTADGRMVGCHYSVGITIGFRTDPETASRTPIYGDNAHFGGTGSAQFSWMLQHEPRSTQAPAAKQGNRS